MLALRFEEKSATTHDTGHKLLFRALYGPTSYLTPYTNYCMYKHVA